LQFIFWQFWNTFFRFFKYTLFFATFFCTYFFCLKMSLTLWTRFSFFFSFSFLEAYEQSRWVSNRGTDPIKLYLKKLIPQIFSFSYVKLWSLLQVVFICGCVLKLKLTCIICCLFYAITYIWNGTFFWNIPANSIMLLVSLFTYFLVTNIFHKLLCFLTR